MVALEGVIEEGVGKALPTIGVVTTILVEAFGEAFVEATLEATVGGQEVEVIGNNVPKFIV